MRIRGTDHCFLVGLAVLLCLPTFGQKPYPRASWERVSSPEQFGWSSEKLREAREYSVAIGSAAVLIVVDGVVLAQWGDTARRFRCHSIRKSFLSALYGIQVWEEQIHLSDTLQELRIDDTPPSLTLIEKQATVGDLLKARSGVYHPALYETPSMAAMRPKRGSHLPGTFWYYNNWDFNVLGTIFEQQTKTKIREGFKRRIADPLQMEDFQLEDAGYVRGTDSIHPAYPFRMSARDLARFGLLFLRDGEWRGKQIIPREWIAESTRSYSDAGQAGGYGYMWWVAVDGKHFPLVNLKEGAFSARGAGGQVLLVVPYSNLVIVHRVDTDAPIRRSFSARQLGRLFRLILDAKIGGNQLEAHSGLQP